VRSPEERSVPIPAPFAADAALSGVWLRAATGENAAGGGAIVAAPHPLYGGSMDHPVCSELAYRCAHAGFASLRFDWRGVGASAGLPSGDLDDAAADCTAALEQVADSTDGPLAACGYSFGAAALVRMVARLRDDPSAGARAGFPRLRRLVLVAPPPGLLGETPLAGFRGRALLLAAAADGIADPDAIERIAAALPGARFVRIPDADHFFMTGTDELGRETARWLETGA
jgi:alpha/beta superfamily hydrolase